MMEVETTTKRTEVIEHDDCNEKVVEDPCEKSGNGYAWIIWVILFIIIVGLIIWWFFSWWNRVEVVQVFNVTVGPKNNTHPFFGQGFEQGYIINGVQGRELRLKKGVTYRFNVNAGEHPFYFTTSPVGNSNAQGNIGVNGTPVSQGSFEWTPTGDVPQPLWYQCAVHENMGGRVYVV